MIPSSQWDSSAIPVPADANKCELVRTSDVQMAGRLNLWPVLKQQVYYCHIHGVGIYSDLVVFKSLFMTFSRFCSAAVIFLILLKL